MSFNSCTTVSNWLPCQLLTTSFVPLQQTQGTKRRTRKSGRPPCRRREMSPFHLSMLCGRPTAVRQIKIRSRKGSGGCKQNLSTPKKIAESNFLKAIPWRAQPSA